MKFIYLCAAVLLLSFTVVPMFTGVSKERAVILASSETSTTPVQDQSLSFEEIYAIAAQGQENQFDPASLNAITPAAGEVMQEGFPSGFSGISDAALTDAPTKIIVTEQDNTFQN
jgi:hypothetical protein